ncbi:hypothetical protein C5746_04645 [Streptomyces atratus]|uniref:H repeat-associated protein N-terminal domain-containing protein n=1 Tax=Streptomyces atratus TaxID=1893 RepID=A0A2Z5J7P0_STRAR|nr:hypothetical protein C5746_04645 [Streptomyces atratus]
MPAGLEQLPLHVAPVTTEAADLRQFLSLVPDPRGLRGCRYPALALLCVAAAAVLTGARSLIAIGEWITDARSPSWACSASRQNRSQASDRSRTPPPSAACSNTSTATHWTRPSVHVFRPERHRRNGPSRSRDGVPLRGVADQSWGVLPGRVATGIAPPAQQAGHRATHP